MLMASRTHRHACTHYARHSTRVYIPLTRKQPTTNIRCAWPHTGTNTDTRTQTDRQTKKHTLIPRYTIVFAHVCACARRHNKTHKHGTGPRTHTLARINKRTRTPVLSVRTHAKDRSGGKGGYWERSSGEGGEWARVERGGGEREDETCARHLATRMMAAAASGSEVPRSFT